MKIFNKKGLTFIEVLISTVISVIIFIVIFSFVADSLNNLSISNKKAEVLSKFYDIYENVGNYRNNYLSGSLIINNAVGIGNDVALIKNTNNSDGIIFGVIDKDTMKIETGSMYQSYGYRVFGYKRLSLSELSKVQSNSAEVYNLSFKDAIIFDTPVRSFQADFFNNGSVFIVDIGLLLAYDKAFKGMLWTDIPKNTYEIFNVNFNF